LGKRRKLDEILSLKETLEMSFQDRKRELFEVSRRKGAELERSIGNANKARHFPAKRFSNFPDLSVFPFS
jgi:hypothetical protein